MKTKINRQVVYTRAKTAVSLLALLIATTESNGHDGVKRTEASTAEVPISYYQAFMISLAGCYGLYLLIRAKRRKKTDNESL